MAAVSLWSKCIKERQGHEVIEEPWGFIEYHIELPFCLIDDLYVEPEFRMQGKAKELAERVTQIAKDTKGCTHLWSSIYRNSFNSTDTLRANLAYGFKWFAEENNRIILVKELGGANG